MTEVIIENEQDKIKIDDDLRRTVEDVVLAALEFEGCDFDAEVSVTIVDGDAIREINREMRDIDAETDVLSFPMLYFDENGDIIDSDFDNDGDKILLGDIVISAPRAVQQAAEYGHSLKREIAFLTVHSMLHLLGYDHVNSEDEEKLMFAKQEKILDGLGITREV